MTYPAELAFKRDRTLSAAARRVYDYLTTILDFVVVQNVKGELHADAAGMDRKTFRKGLNQLIARGYLTEHERAPLGIRRFTLSWNVASGEKSPTSARSA